MSDNSSDNDRLAEKYAKDAALYLRGDECDTETPENGPFSQSFLLGNDEPTTIRDVDGRFGNRRGWESWWWKRPHKLCARCAGECKQSWRVKINRCPQFEAKQ